MKRCGEEPCRAGGGVDPLADGHDRLSTRHRDAHEAILRAASGEIEATQAAGAERGIQRSPRREPRDERIGGSARALHPGEHRAPARVDRHVGRPHLAGARSGDPRHPAHAEGAIETPTSSTRATAISRPLRRSSSPRRGAHPPRHRRRPASTGRRDRAAGGAAARRCQSRRPRAIGPHAQHGRLAADVPAAANEPSASRRSAVMPSSRAAPAFVNVMAPPFQVGSSAPVAGSSRTIQLRLSPASRPSPATMIRP